MHVCSCCIRFGFSVLSQEIDWEEHLRNDLFYVGWDVKLLLSQSIHVSEVPAYWTCCLL